MEKRGGWDCGYSGGQVEIFDYVGIECNVRISGPCRGEIFALGHTVASGTLCTVELFAWRATVCRDSATEDLSDSQGRG